MKIGFYAGSFDPFTNGHLHIIKKASELFDKVIVGIGVNPEKKRRFNQNKMLTAIEKVLVRENITNVEVISYENLTADVAESYNCNFFIRGLRNNMDYEYEENMATVNEMISGLDTIYIRAGKIGNISSTMVEELLRNKKDVSKYIPKEIIETIEEEV